MYYILHTLCLLNSNTKLKSWKKGKEKCHCLHFSIIYNHPLLPTHTHCSMSEPHCSNLSRYLWALGHPASYFFFPLWPSNINNSPCPRGATSLRIWLHSLAQKRNSVSRYKVTEAGSLPVYGNETGFLFLPGSVRISLGPPGDLPPKP